jgi:hypothetical protein
VPLRRRIEITKSNRMTISEDQATESQVLHTSLKETAIKLSFSALFVLALTSALATMAGWLYFLGWLAFTLVMWICG